MSAGCGANLLSTSFAVIARELVGDLEGVADVQRSALAEYFTSRQCPSTGAFIDPAIDLTGVTTHDADYVGWQCTYFSLHALDALNVQAPHRVTLADEAVSARGVSRWLDDRDWSRPWYESNMVMFFLYFLSREAVDPSSQARRTLREALDWLDDAQDPETGLWGTDAGATLLDGVAGAFHILLYYYYYGRPVPCLERLIDSVLMLQNRDGLFSPFGGGGSCEDLDAIDVLCNARLRTSYRRQDIDGALLRASKAICDCRNADGGFRWIRRRDYGVPYWVDLLKPGSTRPYSIPVMAKRGVRQILAPRPDVVAYSGLASMTYRADESDMWSAWFRPLALAQISSVGLLPHPTDFSFTYRRQPGLGWFNPHGPAVGRGLERSDPEDIGLPAAIRQRVQRRYGFAMARTRPGDQVLDVGCGVGWGAGELAAADRTVLGVDIDPQAVEKARRVYESPRCSFSVADASLGGFVEGRFDAILVFEVLEHLGASGALTLLTDCGRLLADNGVLIGSTPTTRRRRGSSSPGHEFHEYEFSTNELLALLRAVFEDVDLRILTSRDVVFVCRRPRPADTGLTASPFDTAQSGEMRSEAGRFYAGLARSCLRDGRPRQALAAAVASLRQDPKTAQGPSILVESVAKVAGPIASHPGRAGVLWCLALQRGARRLRAASPNLWRGD